MGQMVRSYTLVIFILAIVINFLQAAHDSEHQYHSNHRFKRQVENLHPKLKNSWQATDWNKLARSAIDRTTRALQSANNNMAKNVIMFLGDGMGASTIAAARLFKAEFEKAEGTKSYLAWENFPNLGLARTYNVDRSTPDSAGTATAYLSGVKANFFTVGVNEHVRFRDCTNVKGNEMKSTLHKSIDEGKWTGVVTSTRITHASPAGCYASSPDRDWEAFVADDAIKGENCEDIAKQLVTDDRNQDIRVIFGGGLSNFLPNTTKIAGKFGLRKDGLNLVSEWTNRRNSKKQKHAVLKTKSDLEHLDTEQTDYVLGLFNADHLQYEVDKLHDTNEPTLEELTKKAIEILSRSPKGFFLFVEGGRIDHAHHNTNAYRSLSETLAMEKAVRAAYEATNPQETLILVTADHSHVFTLGGYGSFEESVLGFAEAQPLDGKPMLQMMYANGPGYTYHRNNSDQPPGIRMNLTNVDTRHKDFQQDTAIWTAMETHGGEDVPIYATGPWSHLFHTAEEQSYVAHVMMYASCVGDYTEEPHCHKAVGSSASQPSLTFIFKLFWVLLLIGFDVNWE